jgi:ABC-type amino acid transport substrate-binding protein
MDFVRRAGQCRSAHAEDRTESVQHGVVVAHQQSEPREQINLALLGLIESGAYEQLHEKWFGAIR